MNHVISKLNSMKKDATHPQKGSNFDFNSLPNFEIARSWTQTRTLNDFFLICMFFNASSLRKAHARVTCFLDQSPKIIKKSFYIHFLFCSRPATASVVMLYRPNRHDCGHPTVSTRFPTTAALKNSFQRILWLEKELYSFPRPTQNGSRQNPVIALCCSQTLKLK